ncbi:MAG TPA: sugar phosphate isomerase/epimerase family protein [Terracidiphilus sp.]
MPSPTRRTFLQGTAAITALAASPARILATLPTSPFRIAVINDEISPDFDHACSVVANDFGMQWIELRGMWGKNIMDLSADELDRTEKILTRYKLQVTDIASPLFKTDWPGAPVSKFSAAGDRHGAADATFKQQDEILHHAIELAKRFRTDKIRCFDFWRIEEVKPYRAAIDAKLHEAAEVAAKAGMTLILENEFECNTATARESVRTLAAVPSRGLALNWDPGNAVMAGELDTWPVGWQMLPKDRIHHCHVKNTIRSAEGKLEWAPVDKGFVDWAAQFSALKAAGYHGAVSLETHWHGGTPEESTRISWAGMKQALDKAGAL